MYILSWLRPCPLTSSSLVTFHFLVHHHHHPQQYHRRHHNFFLTTSQLIIDNLSLPVQPSLQIATLFFFSEVLKKVVRWKKGKLGWMLILSTTEVKTLFSTIFTIVNIASTHSEEVLVWNVTCWFTAGKNQTNAITVIIPALVGALWRDTWRFTVVTKWTDAVSVNILVSKLET